jgi:hypothetical protein
MDSSQDQRNRLKPPYARDPELRTRRLRSARNSLLTRKHGITLEQFEAQLAAQHGNCACCEKKLGRIRRVHHRRDGRVGLLCGSCCRLVANLRHVRQHARAFEAFFKKLGMTAQLALHHELMEIWGMKPMQIRGEGN